VQIAILKLQKAATCMIKPIEFGGGAHEVNFVMIS